LVWIDRVSHLGLGRASAQMRRQIWIGLIGQLKSLFKGLPPPLEASYSSRSIRRETIRPTEPISAAIQRFRSNLPGHSIKGRSSRFPSSARSSSQSCLKSPGGTGCRKPACCISSEMGMTTGTTRCCSPATARSISSRHRLRQMRPTSSRSTRCQTWIGQGQRSRDLTPIPNGGWSRWPARRIPTTTSRPAPEPSRQSFHLCRPRRRCLLFPSRATASPWDLDSRRDVSLRLGLCRGVVQPAPRGPVLSSSDEGATAGSGHGPGMPRLDCAGTIARAPYTDNGKGRRRVLELGPRSGEAAQRSKT
jgi:hypothetical protein